MLSDLLKWGTRRPDASSTGVQAPAPAEEPVVPSKAFQKFAASLTGKDAPVVLDFGPVTGPNVAFCGERLGCKLFIEDLVPDVARHLRGTASEDLATSLRTRFAHPDGSIDGILCWDVFDFLSKGAAQVLATEIVRLLKPGGSMMGFFCTSGVERAAFTRFEIVDDRGIRHRYRPGQGGKRVSLPNRDIIRMFDGLIVAESFLLKNNMREMLLRKGAAAPHTRSA